MEKGAPGVCVLNPFGRVDGRACKIVVKGEPVVRDAGAYIDQEYEAHGQPAEITAVVRIR